jgi:hypothetical protein
MLRFSLLLMIVLLLLPVRQAFSDVTLIKDGKSDYVIVLPADASAAEKRGASDLQAYLREMSGAELAVVPRSDPVAQRSIVLESQAVGSSAEAFRIKSIGQQIVITGARPRGIMYGCTGLLDSLGVRFFTPKVTRVPKRTTVLVADVDQIHSPAFEYREPFFTEAFNKVWAAHIRNNGAHVLADDSTGGKVSYAEFVHSFDTLIPQKLYKKHPEYFPLINGKRTGGYVQRCLTNPDVLRLAIEGANKAFEDHPDATITSVSQNDCASWCQCDKCNAIVAKYGGNQSGIYIWFVNQVAEAVEKTHPDKLIDTLAYQFTEAPPSGIAPRKNVRVRLCPISCCEAHPYEQCAAAPNKAFVQNLALWGKLTDTLYIWHYNTDFGHYLMPFPDFGQFPDSVRLYKKSGVKGVFFQGAYGPGGGGSDAELRSYVMAKLLWDPTLQASALVDEWMQGVYGPAAAPMRQWFDLLEDRVKKPERHLFIYQAPDAKLFSPKVMSRGQELFDDAQKRAAGDQVASEYVAKSRLWYRYVKIMLDPKVDDEFKSFMADVRKFGIGQLRESMATDAWEAEFIKKHGQPK